MKYGEDNVIRHLLRGFVLVLTSIVLTSPLISDEFSFENITSSASWLASSVIKQFKEYKSFDKMYRDALLPIVSVSVATSAYIGTLAISHYMLGMMRVSCSTRLLGSLGGFAAISTASIFSGVLARGFSARSKACNDPQVSWFDNGVDSMHKKLLSSINSIGSFYPSLSSLSSFPSFSSSFSSSFFPPFSSLFASFSYPTPFPPSPQPSLKPFDSLLSSFKDFALSLFSLFSDELLSSPSNPPSLHSFHTLSSILALLVSTACNAVSAVNQFLVTVLDRGSSFAVSINEFVVNGRPLALSAQLFIADLVIGTLVFKVLLQGSFRRLLPSDLSRPGAFASASIPAPPVSSSRVFADAAERVTVKKIFQDKGCHSCGRRHTHMVICDHQPPRKMAREAQSAFDQASWIKRISYKGLESLGMGSWALQSQVFYPQCSACSAKQSVFMRYYYSDLVYADGDGLMGILEKRAIVTAVQGEDVKKSDGGRGGRELAANGEQGVRKPVHETWILKIKYAIWPMELVVHYPTRLLTASVLPGAVVGVLGFFDLIQKGLEEIL